MIRFFILAISSVNFERRADSIRSSASTSSNKRVSNTLGFEGHNAAIVLKNTIELTFARIF
jgi:hypothetical protein